MQLQDGDWFQWESGPGTLPVGVSYGTYGLRKSFPLMTDTSVEREIISHE
jgi:hypothetical protein